MSYFLKTKGVSIIDERTNKSVTLQGTNFGGWLMMEAYFMHSPNLPEHRFKNHFAKVLGEKELKSFEQSFRANFICEEDVKNIAQIGFNCLRIPFNARMIETKPYLYDEKGVYWLDQVVAWGKKHKVRMILDLHGAMGCQNHDWHSDSAGKAELWTKKEYQKRTFALWEYVADRYKDEEWVAGYDLLNEAVVHGDTNILNQFYQQLIKVIRSVDQNHILFIEGNKWATDVNCLQEFNDDNYALSIHSYEPLAMTFNFVPHTKYPGTINGRMWNKKALREHLLQYYKLSKERQVPIFVGEFGVNYREGIYGEVKWLKEKLECFKEFGFNWTYWTYKAIKNSAFPDGIYSYYDNPLWVNRSGPVMGWDTFHLHWLKHKKEMVESWRTKNFRENSAVLKVLKHATKS